jgi:hypothetical protein
MAHKACARLFARLVYAGGMRQPLRYQVMKPRSRIDVAGLLSAF